MAGFRVVFAVAVVSLCALFYACVVAHLQVPIHYANFQLEVDPRPVPVPAGAEEVHSAVSAQRHVAINMGVKEATLTELKGLLDKHPVAHLLDPKRRRAEESEGSQSQGSKRSKK